MLRALMAVYAVAGLWFAAIWVLEAVELFDPNFNDARDLDDELLIAQALLAFLGALATLAISSTGLAFARSADRRWLARVGLSTLCGLTLLASWIALAGPAGSR